MQKSLVKLPLALFLSLSLLFSLAAAAEAAGTLKTEKGGYRNIGTNTASGYAKALAGAQMEYDDNSSFSSPTLFPSLTNAAGETSASVDNDTWYVREKTAPTGWQTLPQLSWDGATRNYVASANVSWNTQTATIDSGRSTRFVNRLTNPALPSECGQGLSMLLLLDTSTSINGYGNEYNAAAKAFINELSTTPTQLKITSFNTTVSSGNATSYALNTPAGKTGATNRIDAIYPNDNPGTGSTNWDAALQDAANANVDVVVFITDGNPTVRVGNTSSGLATTEIDDITYAVASANTAKNPDENGGPDQTILGVGVGTSISLANLRAVTGPNEGSDYVLAANEDQLTNLLKEVAGKLCPGKLTVKKSLVPISDPGLFNLTVNGDVKASNVSDGGSTGALELTPGSYAVSETAGTGTNLSNYNKATVCRDDTGATVPFTDGKVTIAADDNITCTITNTRRQGTLTVKKSLSPTNDPGKFNLLINGITYASAVGDGGTTGAQSYYPGSYTVTETAALGTNLSSYTKSLSCKDDSGPVDSTGGVILLASDQNVVCTFTNVRQTGTITVNKAVDPSSDPGKFNLLIDGTVYASNVGDGGTTGAKTFNTGIHTVSETAGSGTNLADYATDLTCKDDKGPILVEGGKVDLKDGENITCTFTNTRSSGTITLTKELIPENDPGKFNLWVNSTQGATNVSDGGTTGPITKPTGTWAVFETAGTATDLSDYKSKIECLAGTEPVAVVDGKIELKADQQIECLVTNIRKTGEIKVTKSLAPADDPGLFNLLIGGTSYADDVSDGGTTGFQTLNTGSYAISETAGTDTSLSDYKSELSCQDEEGPVTLDGDTVELKEDQKISCTIANTRKSGEITVTKTLDPDDDPGKFNLLIGDKTYASDVSNGGTTGAQNLPTGSYAISETAGSGTSLSDYNSDLVCEDKEGPVTVVEGKVDLADGQKIVCNFTNTRKTGTITVNKSLVPSDDPGQFDLLIGNISYASNVSDGGTTGPITKPTGSYEITEKAGLDTDLADYNSELACADEEGPIKVIEATVDLAEGQAITCTFTNTRKTGTITLNKSLVPSDDPGTFDLVIDGSSRVSGVGDGGTTGAVTLPTGSHIIGEAPAGSTSLDDYATTLACQNEQGEIDVVDNRIELDEGEDVTCTFTNTRKTGTVKLVKSLSPASDPGTFNLLLDGSVKAAAVGDGGESEVLTLPTGSYTVAEEGAGSTSLSDYQSSLACADEEGTVDSAGGEITVGDKQNITCTFTNTRNTGTLTVTKSLTPSTDTGTFNLLIDGSVVASAVSDGGSSGAQTVNTGSHTISETAAGSTSLADYTTTISCSAGGEVVASGSGTSLSVAVGTGQAVSCLVSNTKPAPTTGTMIITKQVAGGLAPDGDYPFISPSTGDFTLNGGQSQSFTLAPGSYTVSEATDSFFNLDSIVCSDSSDSSGQSQVSANSAIVNLQAGETVECVFTNVPGGVLPVISGSAAISGTSGCIYASKRSRAYVRVRGEPIVRVSFYLRGRLIKRLTEPNRGSSYLLSYPVSKLKRGSNRVTARILFEEGTDPQTATLRKNLVRCVKAKPRYTG